MKTLIMLSAIPASGKSTWARDFKLHHEHTIILNSDDIRMEVTHGDYQDHSHQKEVWELFEQRIHSFGRQEGITVILDALNDTNEVRMKYLSTTPEFDRKVLVMFPNSLERSKKYNGYRQEEVRVPEPILINLVNKFEKPNEEVLQIIDEVRYVYW